MSFLLIFLQKYLIQKNLIKYDCSWYCFIGLWKQKTFVKFSENRITLIEELCASIWDKFKKTIVLQFDDEVLNVEIKFASLLKVSFY